MPLAITWDSDLFGVGMVISEGSCGYSVQLQMIKIFFRVSPHLSEVRQGVGK